MTTTVPQSLPLDVALQQAVAHHKAGRLQSPLPAILRQPSGTCGSPSDRVKVICGFVAIARQVPTSTGMPQVEKLQLSNFLWIICPRQQRGQDVHACIVLLFVDNEPPPLGFSSDFGFFA